jgi:hypothetical protein
MGYPTRKEQDRGGGSHVSRVAPDTCVVQKIAGMVQRHNEHDDTTNDVDRLDTLLARRLVQVGHGKNAVNL